MTEETHHQDPTDIPSPFFEDDDVVADDVADDPVGDGDVGYDDINDADKEVRQEEELDDGEDIGNGWVAYKDDENRTYYYHVETGETQWDRPQILGDMVGIHVEEIEEDAHATPSAPGERDVTQVLLDESLKGTEAARNESLLTANDIDHEPGGDTDNLSQSGHSRLTEEKQTADDSATTTKMNAVMAEQFLQQPDAVMEPKVLDYIDVLVQELGPQVAGPKAMQSLINGYSGDTATCGLLGLWLAQLKSSSSAGESIITGPGIDTDVDNTPVDDFPSLRPGAADSARDVVERVIHQLAKERFTKDYGDAIVKLPKKEAAFIDRMIASKRWRKLLIDLSASNKDSTLFLYCLQSMSNLGYHREIASRINQAEYFGVFNSMLQSELTISAKLSVNGYRREIVNESIDTTKGPMGTLVADLRRTCTSTSYTYLFAMEVFKVLLSKSKRILLDGKCTHPEYLKRAIRKWERLREELEDEMLTPIKTGTTFQRKRKVDIALTMSDLFQRKRRRVVKNVNVDDDVEIDNWGSTSSTSSDPEDVLDSAISQLLMKNSLGAQLDKESADSVLKYAYGGPTDRIGDILVEHPTVINALFENLFEPRQRMRQLETRLKFARLLALAVTASERAANGQSNGAQLTAAKCDDDDVLSKVILKGSQLCEQLENMVSFTVLDNIDQNTEGSAGRQLSASCIRYSVIARGALIWAKAFVSVPDFVSTASYPTISPCILSLARLICLHQPLTRPAVLELSLTFLGHSNREISHRTMQSIKEQSIRLMLWLSTQGLSLAVISAVQYRLEKDVDMDSALLRYYFAGLIEIIQPPFSLPFLRALGGLMKLGPCSDALQSVHFDSSKREQLVALIHQFETIISNQELVEEDKNLLSTLKSKYYCRDK